jgi:hypothetical protein
MLGALSVWSLNRNSGLSGRLDGMTVSLSEFLDMPRSRHLWNFNFVLPNPPKSSEKRNYARHVFTVQRDLPKKKIPKCKRRFWTVSLSFPIKSKSLILIIIIKGPQLFNISTLCGVLSTEGRNFICRLHSEIDLRREQELHFPVLVVTWHGEIINHTWGQMNYDMLAIRSLKGLFPSTMPCPWTEWLLTLSRDPLPTQFYWLDEKCGQCRNLM